MIRLEALTVWIWCLRAGIGAGVDFLRCLSNTRPKGLASSAGKKNRSPISAVASSANISVPKRCVGVNVLKAKIDNPIPPMAVVCVIAVATRR